MIRAHASESLTGHASLLRNWKRWEAGEVEPDDFHKKLIAKTFGTVTTAFLPSPRHRDLNTELTARAGIDTVEILARLRSSDVSASSRRAADHRRPSMSEQLQVEGRSWLRRITQLLDRRLTLAQHQEVLSLAGLVALLLGCVEYDLGRRSDAEATRKAALSLGEEADNADVMGWAHEMRAWYALTQGDYQVAVAAGRAGEVIAPHRSVAVQLAAQEAKAWARMGDRRQMEVALDRGLRIGVRFARHAVILSHVTDVGPAGHAATPLPGKADADV